MTAEIVEKRTAPPPAHPQNSIVADVFKIKTSGN
jgi:hypothetical protein